MNELPLTADAADVLIQQVETRFNLLQYSIDGWCVWPILRFHAVIALLNLPWTRETMSVGNRFLLSIQDVYNLFKLSNKKYLVLVSSSNRAELKDNLYKDIYFDDLLLKIGSYFKLEHVNNILYYSHGRTAQIPSNLTTNGIYIISALLTKARLPSDIDTLSYMFYDVLKTNLNLTSISISKISTMLRNFYWRKRILSWLIGKIQPKSLLMIDAYNNYAIVAAAKEKKVKVVEFQHGLVYKHHPGYSWTDYALPFKPHIALPDQIYLYGDYWKNELQSNGFWENELFSIGSLRLDYYRKQRESRKQSDICKIVVTTQGLDIDRLSNFLIEFLDVISKQLPVHLYIKLHPREHNKQPYLEAFNKHKNVTIYLGAELPSTFDLLIQANFHVSISSTCHYEALGLGIPTIILPLSNHDKVLHLTSTGFAFLVNDPNHMRDIVIQYNHATVPDDVCSSYFRTDALNNMINILTKGYENPNC